MGLLNVIKHGSHLRRVKEGLDAEEHTEHCTSEYECASNPDSDGGDRNLEASDDDTDVVSLSSHVGHSKGAPIAATGVTTRLPKTAFNEWFQHHVLGSGAAREAVLGRSVIVPHPWEVLIQTGVRGGHVESEMSPDGDVDMSPCDICLVTHCSIDRLDQLEAQMVLWDGELSAAVFIDAPADSLKAETERHSVEAAFARAHKRQNSVAKVHRMPPRTITVVYQMPPSSVRCPAYDTLYPVNKLRNEALRGAHSRLVLLVDVDFMPSQGLYRRLCGTDKGRRLHLALSGRNKRGKQSLLVVPAFEAFSTTKDQVVQNGKALAFQGLHAAHQAGTALGYHMWYRPQGHGPTNFERWFAGQQAPQADVKSRQLHVDMHGVDAYHVKYADGFEPFIVAARESIPAYDERFKGYGMNKIAHTFDMAYQGFNFFVVDHHDAFLIAKWHPRSASSQAMCSKDAERQQLRRVAAHFRIFKEELRSRAGSRSTVIVSVPQVSCTRMPKRVKERNASECCRADTCVSDGSTSGGHSRAHSDSSASFGT
mmetsp:Transcript_25727/g.59478  ORF Transcript_25727/g.59478 Transcript_25727/m.59478 type:complete len:538 (-) Transcript_25727:98-1711(-)